MLGLVDRGRKHLWHKCFSHLLRCSARRVNVAGRIQFAAICGPMSGRSRSSTVAPVNADSVARARTGALPTPNKSQCHPGHSLAVELDPTDRAAHGKVARAASHLVDGPAATAGPHGKVSRHQDLVRLHGRCPRRHEEVRSRNAPAAVWPGDLERSVDRHRRSGIFRSGVRMRQRPAKRAPVADLIVADVAKSPWPARGPQPRPGCARRWPGWSWLPRVSSRQRP